MKRMIFSPAIVLVAVSLFTPTGLTDAPAAMIRAQEDYTVSLALKFRKKKQNSLQRAISILDYGPNGYASGFIVGDGLIMTAYHVVSGDLSSSKKVALGFGPKDQLEVSVSVDGCQATVLSVDADADIALLRACRTPKQSRAPAFQSSPAQDEKLFVIARPHDEKLVRRGRFSGPYMLGGRQYWSATIEGRDGYSGSPVYNDRAEIVGVFSRYDWSKKLAVISPGTKARQLLEGHVSVPVQAVPGTANKEP